MAGEAGGEGLILSAKHTISPEVCFSWDPTAGKSYLPRPRSQNRGGERNTAVHLTWEKRQQTKKRLIFRKPSANPTVVFQERLEH